MFTGYPIKEKVLESELRNVAYQFLSSIKKEILIASSDFPEKYDEKAIFSGADCYLCSAKKAGDPIKIKFTSLYSMSSSNNLITDVGGTGLFWNLSSKMGGNCKDFHTGDTLHSEVNAISKLRSNINSIPNDIELALVLSARPCIACSLAIAGFQKDLLSRGKKGIKYILLAKNDLYPQVPIKYPLGTMTEGFYFDFQVSLKNLLDTGSRVFMYVLNNNNIEYRNMEGCSMFYDLLLDTLNMDNSSKDKLDIDELSYEQIVQVQEETYKQKEEKISDYRDSIYASLGLIGAFLVEGFKYEGIRQYSGIALSTLTTITFITTIIFGYLYIKSHNKKLKKESEFLSRYNFGNWTLGSLGLFISFFIGGLTLESPLFFWGGFTNASSYLPGVAWLGVIGYIYLLIYCVVKINGFKK